MNANRAAIISLPWAEYRAPSVAIGALASFARRYGHKVDALQLHLPFAALFGIDRYDKILDDVADESSKGHVGEALCAALLYKDEKHKLLEYIGRSIDYPQKNLRSLERSLTQIYKTHDWSHYRLIGFSTTLGQLFASLLFASWIKKDHPNIRIVLGGDPVRGALGASILKTNPHIDWCVDGEGELAFTALLNGLKQKTGTFETEVPGLIYRDGDRICHNEKKQIPDLSNLPDPDFDDYYNTLNELDSLANKELYAFLPIETSRGCLFRCAFCGDRSVWQGYRMRKPEAVAKLVKRLTKKNRVDRIIFTALMMSPDYLKTLSRLLSKHRRDYKIVTQLRADTPKEVLIELKKAGACEAQIGIEALDSKLLKKMNKGTTTIQNLAALKYCAEIGLDAGQSNLMINFPTETGADLDRTISTIDFAIQYSTPNVAWFILKIGSLVAEQPQKYGVTSINHNTYFYEYLPTRIAHEIKLQYLSFKSRNMTKQHHEFLNKMKKWKKSYEEAKKAGRYFLSYTDCKDFLRIEDFREGSSSVTLEGWIRDLYLYCDKIRKLDEIQRQFSEIDSKELKRTLQELYKLKVMFKEGNDWLSLAIHASPENRRHMPFL
ncbi:MAG: RiPP maturation radical SAM C-methyltransferase [Pseudomonadota bacterium]